ncbi:EAL domain-containing protein [uncultured Ferrimonas sp.]|uniref:putative bifunctional diguanylate cyclase/phosphodiesterase n=1 Tax=uncultured Ferrimonas sp. TaxID=432640 RepID=UPI00263510C4|nr:EAL domain-containing protein [uncultured Ferrimonas sp.]
MASFRQNIWALYWGILLFSFALLSYTLAVQWQNTQAREYDQLSNTAKMLSHSARSVFRSKEMVLDLLGVELIDNDGLSPENLSKTVRALDRILEFNEEVDALAVMGVDGRWLAVSSNLDAAKLPHLPTDPLTAASYARALTQTKMVLGRTYAHPSMQSRLGIPFRKAIRDPQGNVLAVLAGRITLSSKFLYFSADFHLERDNEISFLRSQDQYYQLRLALDSSADDYRFPLNLAEINRIVFASSNGQYATLAEAEQHNALLTFERKQSLGQFLVASAYDARYELWASVKSNKAWLLQHYFQHIWFYPLFYVSFLLVLFYLFRLVGTAEDERRRALLQQAVYDPLTSLPNRTHLHRSSKRWMARRDSFSLLYIDLDHFKKVNDGFGHQAGDAVLKQTAQRLLQRLPKGARACRYGGDEFIVLLPQNTDIQRLCEQLVQDMAQPISLDGLHCELGASIGVAHYPEHGETLDDLLRGADIAMYEAKKYRNRSCVFSSKIQQDHARRLGMERQLRLALSANEMYLMYQPQVDSNGQIYGVEALLRWQNAEFGLVAPDEFIPLAERSGQMLAIGQFVIATALHEIGQLQQHLPQPLKLSINISVNQFMHEHFLAELEQAITDSGVNRADVVLEITENLFIEDVNALLPLLNQLHQRGIKISMDDFGTGFSSLSLLRQLPVDELKIDKSFVDDILEQDTARTMVKSIVDIGRNYQMTLLAEGVEQPEQMALLRQFGCQCFQGYLFSKPVSVAQLLPLLQGQYALATEAPPKTEAAVRRVNVA